MATRWMKAAVRGTGRGIAGSGAFALITVSAGAAPAGPVPDYDFHWANIGDVDNPAIHRDNTTWYAIGRGSVGYRYRISKYEVTTAQWMEFVNTFSTQSDGMGSFARPTFWGAAQDDTYHGPGTRYVLRNDPNAGRMPVFGLTWHEAAYFVNWLQNGKSSSPDAIADGVYDTSTFNTHPGGAFDDQRTHHPDARFWIPTWDEWLKAAHYNPATESWNEWPSTQNMPLESGPPGVGDTSAGIDSNECGPEFSFCPFDIPLGAYDTVSSYGMFDASGGTTEWTEEVYRDEWRIGEGVYAGGFTDPTNIDSVYWFDTRPPDAPGFMGLRIAGLVPAPGTAVVWAALCVVQLKGRGSR